MSPLGDSPIDGDAALRAEYAAALIVRGIRALDLAARMHATDIAVDQQPQQHRRVMGGRAAPPRTGQSDRATSYTLKDLFP
jgi:hypothetical protein